MRKRRSIGNGGHAPGDARSPVRQHRRTSQLTAATLATAVAVGALTACGSASDGGSSTTTACNTPGFAGNEIKLGFIYPDTGPVSASFRAAKAGFIARVEQQNASGGIHGRQISYEWRDDQADKVLNNQVSQQLVNDGVFGIVESTIATSGGADELRDQNVPVIGLPAEPLWADHHYPNMFAHSYVFGAGGAPEAWGKYVLAQGGSRVAVINSDVAQVSNDINQQLATSFRSVGLTVSPQTFVFNNSITDVVALGRQLKAAGVDTVAGAVGAADISEIMRGARIAGAPIKVFLSASGYDNATLRAKGQVMAGLSTFLNYVPTEAGSPAHVAFLNAMRQFAPELDPPNQELALLAYIHTDMLLAGLQAGPACPTRASFISTMHNLNYNGGGLLPGPVNLKDWGQLSHCYAFVKVNAAGTGYDVVKGPDAGGQWCGDLIT